MNNAFSNTSSLRLKIENSILYGTYKKNLTVDIELAIKMVEQTIQFVKDKKYPALADIRDLKYITKEARDYLAKDGVQAMTALAVLVGNYITVIITNLFITFSKPKVPTKAFRTKEQAEKWLMQFVNSNV